MNHPDSQNAYIYVINNPLIYVDPSCHILDTIVDAASFVYDAYEFVKDPSWSNAGHVGLDLVSVAVPFVPSGSAALRASSKVASKADDGLDAVSSVAKGAGNAVNGAPTVEQAGISASEATRIQNEASRTGQEINVVGSRANGTASATSDWDYVMSGNSAHRHSAASSVPKGTSGGEINSMGRETGIDIFTNYPNSPKFQPLDPTKPSVAFKPPK